MGYSPWGYKESHMTDIQEERKFRSVPSLHLLSVSSTVFAMFLLNRLYCFQVGFVLCHFFNSSEATCFAGLESKIEIQQSEQMCVC